MKSTVVHPPQKRDIKLKKMKNEIAVQIYRTIHSFFLLYTKKIFNTNTVCVQQQNVFQCTWKKWKEGNKNKKLIMVRCTVLHIIRTLETAKKNIVPKSNLYRIVLYCRDIWYHTWWFPGHIQNMFNKLPSYPNVLVIH